jgi:zinc protease
MTAQLLAEGAGSLDGAALTERVEALGSSLSTAADWDCIVVSLGVIAERFGSAVELLGDVLMQPMLPEREFERLRGERLAELLQLRTEPRSLADETFAALLFSESSRFARPLGGSDRSVKSLSLREVQEFHSRHFAADSVTVIVAGDVTANAAVRTVDGVFGNWHRSGASPSDVRYGARELTSAIQLITKEGAPQSELRIGVIGPPRRTQDYFETVVMNAILGGLFSSRININLREKHGYTYGAFSQFDWRRVASPFIVSTAVRSDVTVASISEVRAEIRRMRDELVEEDELSLALNYLGGVFPIRFETTAAIASALVALVIFDLPSDYYDTYRSLIAGVTRERVRNAAVRHIDEEGLRVVVVGDPAVVGDPLRSYAGSVAIHDDVAALLD